MYHPAKVQQLIKTNGKTRVLIQTWDQNTFTVDTADDLDADTLSEGSIVLLDYYPDPSFDIPTPKQVATAVLEGEQGEEIWSKYEEIYEETQGKQTAMMQAPNMQFDGGYIG